VRVHHSDSNGIGVGSEKMKLKNKTKEMKTYVSTISKNPPEVARIQLIDLKSFTLYYIIA
jgi:hypothetical protein